MFAQKSLALELSDKSVRYCLLEKGAKRFRLTQAGSVELDDVQFSRESFAKALAEILTKIGTSHVKLFVNILRREVLFNSVILPQMPPNELEEVIGGEIVKIPTYFDKEFDFIFSSFPYVDTKMRVMYCAVYREIINGIVDAAKQHKLALQEIALAPMSLLRNAYTWGDNGTEQMLVVVGDTSNYVMAFQQKQCKFFFSGSMGRSALVKNGVSDKLSMLAWTTDTNRIITSYFMAHGGQMVQKIFLIWDNDGVADLATELEERLSKTVVKTDLKMFPDIEYEGGAEINPAYFVAISPVVSYYKNLKSEFSFEKFLEAFNYNGNILKIVGQLGVFIALGVFMVFAIGRFALIENHKASEQLSQVKSKITLIETENQKDDADASLSDTAKGDILAQLTTVNNINKVSWSKVFDAVVNHMPQGVSFTSFKVMDTGDVDIKGRTYNIETIGSFMHSLGDIPFLQDIKATEIKDTQSEEREINQQEKKTFSFDITAELVNG